MGLVLIDFKKAYDTFNNEILGRRLDFYGAQAKGAFTPIYPAGNNFVELMVFIRKLIL